MDGRPNHIGLPLQKCKIFNFLKVDFPRNVMVVD